MEKRELDRKLEGDNNGGMRGRGQGEGKGMGKGKGEGEGRGREGDIYIGQGQVTDMEQLLILVFFF